MPLGKSGAYHMNPARMRAMGDAPEELTGEPSMPGEMNAAQGVMIQCPECGATFPEQEGMQDAAAMIGEAAPDMGDTSSDGM